MCSIDHPSGASEDANMHDTSLAVATLAPEDQVTRLGLTTGKVLAHLGVVLSLGSSG